MVNSETLTVQDKALAYIENVLPLDIKRYNITLENHYMLPPEVAGTSTTEAVNYILTSNESRLRVHFMFENGVLYECTLIVEAGSVISARSYANLTDMAKDILEKYQAHTGADTAKPISMLDMIDETKSRNVTSGNIDLSVSHLVIPDVVNDTSFLWTYVFNGAEYTHVLLSFNKGVFHILRDDRAIYTIGSTDVKVTKEQAIDIAVKYIEKYSYWFNETEDRAVAGLASCPRNGAVLYPFWSVVLDFNQAYGGDISVRVWADSGEVFECYQGGSPLRIDDSNPQPTPTPQPENSASSTATQPLPSGNSSESPSTSPEVQSSDHPDSASTPSPAIDNPALSAGTPSPHMVFIGLATATAIFVTTAAKTQIALSPPTHFFHLIAKLIKI